MVTRSVNRTNIMPTANIDLMNVHEKNKNIQCRVDDLQNTAKQLILNNLKTNNRHDADMRKIKREFKETVAKDE